MGKNWFKLSLVVVFMMFTVLVGCSQESAAPAGGTNTTTAEGATPEGSAGGESEPAGEAKKPRVGFVYIGQPGDGGWTYEHDIGRKYMEEKIGITATFVENVPEGADAERVITELAQNNDIVFTTSFGYMDYTYNVAQKFPEVIFMHTAGYKTAENMGTYFGRNYQASYLSGIAAGKMTKNNTLGYVGAFPIPEVISNINAFTLGAQSVNKDAKVKVVWSNTWFDPAAERQAAISLLDQGADVLLAYQDSPAAIQAAGDRGLFAGGNDSDMGKYAPETYMTNPIWNWGPYYTKVVEDVMNGTWTNEPYLGDMKDEMVGLAPLGKNVPEDVKKLVEDTKAKILNDELNVFAGPIYDANGELKVEEGQNMTDEVIYSIDWFVQGVEGTIPN